MKFIQNNYFQRKIDLFLTQTDLYLAQIPVIYFLIPQTEPLKKNV